MANDRRGKSSVPPPPPVARMWVRMVVAFSVSVALGLAPYLGRLRVPLFDALLTLVPDDLHSIALPVSAALMGLIAVWVQWSADDRPRRTWLRKRFRLNMVLAAVGLLLLVVVETFVVVRIPIRAENRIGVYLIGVTRLPTSPCPPQMSDVECVSRVTPEEGQLAKVWGDDQLRACRLALLASYFMATASFGLLVGLLVLRNNVPRPPLAGTRHKQQRAR
jgi:hypothetical protein